MSDPRRARRDSLEHLRALAAEWIAADPDPETRARLQRAVDEPDLDELRAALAAPLAFGTAGLRGPVGPGPARMNRATVIRTTRGLADHVLATTGTGRPVVVGHDARVDSARFADDVAGVLAAAGLVVRRFATSVPTPLVAYAARVEAAAAAVVITASHNPPADNGYKVYGPDARQIAPPLDEQIAAAVAAVGPAAEVPRLDPGRAPTVRVYGEELGAAYLAELAAVRPAVQGPDRRIVYTPLHGVGGALVTRALADAGYRDVQVVPGQAEPDGRFPTVAFPNPEEPGALDEALELAHEVRADLVLANDPDADRLAVAVPDAHGSHRPLTGNELGVLLGDHLLRHHPSPRPLVVTTVVSSPMLAAVAAGHGARHEVSLTGFKWICRAAAAVARDEDRDFVFGYEEALGYVVGEVVRDKDGIGAAVVAADLVRSLAAGGETVGDRLEELHQRHGLWVSRQHRVTLPATTFATGTDAVLDAVADRMPASLGGRAVLDVRDHRRGAGEAPWRPPSPMLEVRLPDGRALLRPSGTEPRVKVYVDLRQERSGDPAGQRQRLLAEADAVGEELADLVTPG